MKCSICDKKIKCNDVSVGTGNGSGNSFAHYDCYYKQNKIEESKDNNGMPDYYSFGPPESYKPKDDFTVNAHNDETIVITKKRYNELVKKEQKFDEVIKIAGRLCTRLMMYES